MRMKQPPEFLNLVYIMGQFVGALSRQENMAYLEHMGINAVKFQAELNDLSAAVLDPYSLKDTNDD